jgi:Mrp family chromosome partitioning ATPase
VQQLALSEAGERGLVDLILDPGLALDDVVCAQGSYNLDILAAGKLPPAPYEILKSQRLGEILEEARARYDYVVLDTAPLVPVPDSRLVMKWIDGLLLVVAAHKTPSKLLAEALNLLEPAKLIGIVFNEDDRPVAGYRYYYPPYGAPLDEGRRPGWLRSLWQKSVASARERKGRRRSRA